MSDTPRTDIMATGNSNPSVDEYEDLLEFTRQLERELNAPLAKKLRGKAEAMRSKSRGKLSDEIQNETIRNLNP